MAAARYSSGASDPSSISSLSSLFTAALGMKNAKDYELFVAPALLNNGGSIGEIAAKIATDLNNGICDTSSIADRRAEFGVNMLPTKPMASDEPAFRNHAFAALWCFFFHFKH